MHLGYLMSARGPLMYRGCRSSYRLLRLQLKEQSISIIFLGCETGNEKGADEVICWFSCVRGDCEFLMSSPGQKVSRADPDV